MTDDCTGPVRTFNLTLWIKSSSYLCFYFFLLFWAEYPYFRFLSESEVCSGSCPCPTIRSCVVVVCVNGRALWLVLSSPDLWRELARRAHAAEWLERFQRFRRLQQGSSGSVLQPAARRYDTGEEVHSGETDAASTQSDGGILARGWHRETGRCHVQLGLCGGRFPKAGLSSTELYREQAAPLPTEHTGAGGRPPHRFVLHGKSF